MMQLKDEGAAAGRERQLKVLCIDNHASSNYTCFLLARNGYKVNCANFLCDALEMIHGSSYDLYLINDELACGSDKELLNKVREAMGATPVLFYSTVIYPFNPRLADQSGNTPETPVPVTEVPIAVYRTIGHALLLARRGASVSARQGQRSPGH
jgi:hypothetical protein